MLVHELGAGKKHLNCWKTLALRFLRAFFFLIFGCLFFRHFWGKWFDDSLQKTGKMMGLGKNYILFKLKRLIVLGVSSVAMVNFRGVSFFKIHNSNLSLDRTLRRCDCWMRYDRWVRIFFYSGRIQQTSGWTTQRIIWDKTWTPLGWSHLILLKPTHRQTPAPCVSAIWTAKEMILAGLTPNMTTCNAALCAAKVAGCWQEAEELLEKQFGCRTIPNTLSSVFGVRCSARAGYDFRFRSVWLFQAEVHDVTSSETDLPMFHHTKTRVEAVVVCQWCFRVWFPCCCEDAKLWFAARCSKLYSGHRCLWCSRTLGRSIEAAPQGWDWDHSGAEFFVEKVMTCSPFRGILDS